MTWPKNTEKSVAQIFYVGILQKGVIAIPNLVHIDRITSKLQNIFRFELSEKISNFLDSLEKWSAKRS